MARDTMSISLPSAMVREVDQARKREHRTRSELVREALRTYFVVGRALPTYTPTQRELRAIEKGRDEIRRGEYVTLDELNHQQVAGSRRKARPKKARARRAS